MIKKWVLFNSFEREMLLAEIVELLRNLMAFLGATRIKVDHSIDDVAFRQINTLL